MTIEDKIKEELKNYKKASSELREIKELRIKLEKFTAEEILEGIKKIKQSK